jgi:N-acetylmuramoyl-L-alanine amidase
LSAGHGGPANIGAVHRDALGNVDLVEKDLNLEIARRIGELLRAAGYETLLIRDGDYSLSTASSGDFGESVRAESQARADLANEAGADIIIAIHFNGSEDPGQSGTGVYYNPDRDFGEANRVLATSLYDALLDRLRALGHHAGEHGVLDDGLTAAAALTGTGHTYLLGEAPGFRVTTMPGAIVEALFLTNDADAAFLTRDEGRQAIAEAYVDGIERYFDWLAAGGATPTP